LFGHLPQSVGRHTELRPAPPRRVGKSVNGLTRMFWSELVMAALPQRWLRVLRVGWRIPRRRGASAETVVASLGLVAIRDMPACCFVGTCVSGEPTRARETALRLLTDYLNGDNRGTVVLQAERPVIQQQIGPHRWRISVRLPTVADALIAPAPRAPKVKLWSAPPGWLAVVRISGRPVYHAMAGGDAMVLDAIAGTEWVATGGPMIRLHQSGPLQWFADGFEVVVPVAPRCRDDERSYAVIADLEHLPAG
jgi:hypothetical protein